MKRCKSWLMLILFLLLMIPTTAFADGEEDKNKVETVESDSTEDNTKGALSIQIYSDYDLSEKDVFRIVIKDCEKDQQTLEINAYDAYFEGKKYSLHNDEFSVEGMKYEGVNDVIMRDTYACDKSFAVMSDDESTLNLYIGDQQINYVSKEDLVFGHKKKKFPPEENTVTEERTIQAEEKTELSYDFKEQKDPSKDAVVEKVEKKNEVNKDKEVSFHVGKLIPIAVIGVSGMAVIYLWFKKKENEF